MERRGRSERKAELKRKDRELEGDVEVGLW